MNDGVAHHTSSVNQILFNDQKGILIHWSLFFCMRIRQFFLQPQHHQDLFGFSFIDKNLWLTETNSPCCCLWFWVAINSSRCPLAAVNQASAWGANAAFVHLSSASSPTFTVKGLFNRTCGSAVFIATLSLSKSGHALQTDLHRNITLKLFLHSFLSRSGERHRIFFGAPCSLLEVTGVLFSVCMCLLVLFSFLCSWVWSSSWSWLQGSLPSSLRTGSKTSLTFSSTIMSRHTAMTSTCRISSTLPRNMWVHPHRWYLLS